MTSKMTSEVKDIKREIAEDNNIDIHAKFHGNGCSSFWENEENAKHNIHTYINTYRQIDRHTYGQTAYRVSSILKMGTENMPVVYFLLWTLSTTWTKGNRLKIWYTCMKISLKIFKIEIYWIALLLP